MNLKIPPLPTFTTTIREDGFDLDLTGMDQYIASLPFCISRSQSSYIYLEIKSAVEILAINKSNLQTSNLETEIRNLC